MSKIGIVIQREYVSRVRKKSFILLTFLMPLLFVGLILGTIFLSGISDSTEKNIVVYDQTGKYFPIFQDIDNYHFIQGGNGADVAQNRGDKTVYATLYATLMITQDLLVNPSAVTVFSEQLMTLEDKRIITSPLNKFLSEEKLESYNIPNLKEIIDESNVSVNLQTIKWDNDGNEKASSTEIATVVGMIFTFLIYMFIFVYGAMVMQGVLEEKTNRIVEVMISSVKPFDLMMGKIIGIGLVGLTQFFLWAILIVILNVIVGVAFVVPNMDVEAMQAAHTAAATADISKMQEVYGMISSVNFFELGAFFILFFVGGYLVYASLFAAIGSMVDSSEDTQQFMMPITVIILFAFYAGLYSVNNPNGPLAFWTSMIPFTSPVVMMTRIPFEIPLWEKLLSIVLLFVTVFLMVKLSAKIYRVGILMYGKKPSVKEIWKWLKY